MPGVMALLPNGKSNHFGIEVVSGLKWKGWEPGQEYTKNIILKNIKVKTQKLKYRPPETRFFTTLYPQPIVLSAGTSFTLPITFRPLEKVVYSDKIQFETSAGTFAIPMQALLPQPKLEVPETINFNMCAAEDFVQLTFEIKNKSELVTPFQVECSAPFLVEPAEAVLEPHSTLCLTATFKPTAALVYQTSAVFKYGQSDGHTTETKFEGIGKYPHLLVRGQGMTAPKQEAGANEVIVNFGSVSVGQSAERWMELHNLSPVNAPFTVEHVPRGPSAVDAVFQCLQRSGVAPAMSYVRLPISYSPNTVGVKNTDYFNVKAIGNISKTCIACVGSCKGPVVTLSHSHINFHQVDSGQTGTRTFDIVNDSDAEATFQFQLDWHESVFKFQHVSGVLPANSKKTVIIQFKPSQPINYYRRVTCLVHHQDPVFLDLLGTCHTETVKPAILQAKHVTRYRCHINRGLSMTPPEHLNEMMAEGKLLKDPAGALYAPTGNDDPPGAPSLLDPLDEYFNDGYYSDVTQHPPHVSLDVHQADFGQCSDVTNIEQQTISVTNHTKGKVTVVWMGAADHTFSMTPTTIEIPPLKSCSFRLTFKPRAPNQFFGAELEGYAYYKSLRDYRMVEDTTHSPPWCLTMVATGHTFMAHNETFLPRYSLDSTRMVFPAVNSNEATYRTLALTNTGTTPILYDFEKDTTGVFSYKPTSGLVPAGGRQVYVVKCLPRAVQRYKHLAKLRLNAMEKKTQEVVMLGSAEAPEVILDDDGVLFFKPTCIGTTSSGQYGVKNVSRIPLRFEWQMTRADGQLLAVEPSSGVIEPNQHQFHRWMFSPKKQDKFIMKPALIAWGQGQSSSSSSGRKRQFLIRAIGEGTVGEIKVEQAYLDFGAVVVGSTASKHIALVNDSDCSLQYSLSLVQNISGPYPDEETAHDPQALALETMGGVIPARSREILLCTIRPARRLCYQWTISYRLVAEPTQGQDAIDPSLTEEKHLCHVLATGVFPTMAVTDARCYGSAMGISKKQLWGLFSVDNFNICLDSDPSPAELMYSMATRQSHNRRPPVYTRAILDFNFSAAPLGSEPCVVQLMFENTGTVPSEWAFLFPNDLQIELEYWAETGEFDAEELHEMKVMDNKLFNVDPKQGSLEPGDCQTVTLTYNHTMAGTDRLPVLLKLARGREILLNFVGVTVEPERRYIHFPSSRFLFTPVPIAESNSPKQIYELYNGGAVPVKYEIDLSPLEQVKLENYDHEVFECLNPVGEILPGKNAAVEWKFSPLEAKTYMVDVPIHVHNGDTAIVTFTGVGYDKRHMGDTMPITDNHDMSGVPSVQSALIPGQLCCLSEERVSLGNVPLFSRARRVVAITNKSTQHAVIFKWHVTSKSDAKILSIRPSQASLQPGEAQLCKVTFIASGSPSFFDLDLVCEVTNMTEYNEYSRQLDQWETEKRRQRVEFTVTEENPDADDRLPSVEDRPPSGRLRSLESEKSRTPSPDADLTKYRTLPPIRPCAVQDDRTRERGQRRFNEAFWARPEPPKPFLLHLGVTARTHDTAQYQQHFPDQYNNYIIDRMLCDQDGGAKTKMAAREEKITCLSTEADLVAGTMANVIRGLLDDSQFQEACAHVINAPVPYFSQFSPDKPPRSPPKETVSDILIGVQDRDSASTAQEPTGTEVSGHVSATEPMGEPVGEDLQSPQPIGGEFDGFRSPLSERDADILDTDSLEHDPVDVPFYLSPTPSDEGLMEVETRQNMSTSAHSGSIRVGSVASSSGTSSKSSKRSKSSGTSEGSNLTVKQKRSPTAADIKLTELQSLKKSPEYGKLTESLLENTLMNILEEAFSEQFNITARPRMIALPPKPTTPKAGRGSVSK